MLSLQASRLPAFVDSGRLRLALGTFLYLAQGFPQAIAYYAIPTWFAATGQSIAVVGSATAAASLPWTIKFLLGFVVDRYTWLPMGRRRPWLIGAQMAIIVLLAGFAMLSPSADATILIIGFAFLLSTLTALQDVALDAIAADLTPDAEKGRLNGYMFAGKLLGIAGGMSIMGYVLQYYTMREAMLVMLVCFTIPAAIAILVRERPGEKLLPWTTGVQSAQAELEQAESWSEVFKGVLSNIRKPTSLGVVAILLIFGLHQAIYENSVNLFAIRKLGWSQAFVSSFLAGANICAAGFCLLAGGWIVDKVGPARVTLISALAMALLCLALSVNEDFFANDAALIGWYAVSLLPEMLFYLSTMVLAMRVAESQVAASALAIIFGTQALGMTLGGTLLAPLDNLGGFQAMFAFAAVAIMGSGSFGLALRHKVGNAANGNTHARRPIHPEAIDLDGLT